MAKFKLRLNSDGVVQMLNDPGVAAYLYERGQSFAGSAPGEWDVAATRTRDRAAVFVRTADSEARREAAENPGGVLGNLRG